MAMLRSRASVLDTYILKPPGGVAIFPSVHCNISPFCKYNTRFIHTSPHCRLPTPTCTSLLPHRGTHLHISPILYPATRYFSTEKDTEKEKDKEEGFAATIKRWENKSKKVVQHYWLGTKLLYTNIGITWHLVKSLVKGHTLTRRERKLLVQTSADIFRLIPFIIIVVVPFMELALPILLKFFPNLLPSTYEWKDKKDEDRAKRLRANVEIAKFLQETMGELSHDLKKAHTVNADEFLSFMTKVKKGEQVTNKDVLELSKLFDDELTLDKISREQLVAMHNYLYGKSAMSPVKWLSTDYLRTRISNKIERIKQDDILIQKEGLDQLTLDELVDASVVRGMHVEGLSQKEVKEQLRSWLDLSLNHSIPPALLVLSRAFMMHRAEPATEALTDTLAHIPQEALEEVVRELPADYVERKKERLEDLQKQRALVEKEEKMTKEQEAKKAATQAPAQPHVEEAKEQKPKKISEKEELAAEIQEIKKIDTEVETLKQLQGKMLEEITSAPKEEGKSPKVLARKLEAIIKGLEEEIDKIELEQKAEAKETEEKEEAKGEKKEGEKEEAKAEAEEEKEREEREARDKKEAELLKQFHEQDAALRREAQGGEEGQRRVERLQHVVHEIKEIHKQRKGRRKARAKPAAEKEKEKPRQEIQKEQ